MASYLPEKRAEIIRLFLAGLTYGQIAARLKVQRGTVGGHLARWRAELVDADHTHRQPSQITGDAETVRQRRADTRFVRALALAFQRGDHLPVTGNSVRPQRQTTVPRQDGVQTVHRAEGGVSSCV